MQSAFMAAACGMYSQLSVTESMPSGMLQLDRPGIREQTKPKFSCQNQEFSETELRFWFRSGTFLGFLVSDSVPGFKFVGLPG